MRGNARGENNPHAKLTVEQVKRIREDYDYCKDLPAPYRITYQELATHYGVSRRNMRDIISKRSWKGI